MNLDCFVACAPRNDEFHDALALRQKLPQYGGTL